MDQNIKDMGIETPHGLSKALTLTWTCAITDEAVTRMS